ncbi:hypothetical protein ABFT23_00185 [Nocardioides sp. C4-1]|uniref:hypothetical protein n=1 Tax=Nocardioides sp. C4-1 TaxID=3151851 RepID=UPI00326541F2
MPSTLACLGLDVDSVEALNTHLESMPSSLAGRTAGVESVRYTDLSGARVVVVRDENGETLDLVPSYDARPGALLGDLGPFGPVVQADVLGDDNEVVTRLATDLEQHRHLRSTIGGPLRASLVALGVEMAVHDDEAAFAASDASRLDGGDQRFGAESFLSYGLFGSQDAAEPTAHLAGVVLEATTQTNKATGQDFHVARVRTVGFEATVCLAASSTAVAPRPGNVVAGACWVVADVPTLWTVEPPRKRRRR